MRKRFEAYIDSAIANIQGDYIDIEAKDVHTTVGRYPGINHRMPVCCDVMYNRMRAGDTVLYAPPKGKGASLKIRYFKRVCGLNNEQSSKLKDELIEMFNAEMLEYHNIRKKLKYEATIIENSIKSIGGYKTAIKFCDGSAKSGFIKLSEKGILEYSLEAIVIKPEYGSIFAPEKVEKCKKLLEQYGYNL